jgi:hypothetical protein
MAQSEDGEEFRATPAETEDERREAIAEANAAFDAQRAEEEARGIVRRWDGANGRTTAQVLETLRQLGDRTQGGR